LHPDYKMNKEIHIRILEGANELFFSYGLKSITMDDIARHLGMSKKTIYVSFKDKDEIVSAFMKDNLEKNKQALLKISDNSVDSVQEIIGIMRHFGSMFSRINPRVFYDLQKYFHESWKIFREFKESQMIAMIEKNLRKGIKEGVFRSDLNIKIIAKLRVEQIEMSMNPLIFPPDKFNISEIHVIMLELFLHGITTTKGHALIDKYKKITKE
jgi:AcrR family transcriptional regulator